MNTRHEIVGNSLGDECSALPACAYPHAVPAPLHSRQPDRSDAVPVGYKRTVVGLIPSDWNVVRIGDLFESTAGGDFDPHRSSDVQSDSHPYPIYANGLSQEGLYGFSDYTENRTGSITITARGTLGIAHFRDTPFVAIGRLLVLKPKIRMDARYFSNYINHGVHFAVESTGVPQLTAPQVARYSVPVPPEAEQRTIAEALSDSDGLLAALEALIAKKQAIKRAAVQQLLTGKTRLPGFGGAWESKRLRDIGPFSKGRGIKREDVSFEGLPCVRYGELYTRYHNYILRAVSRVPPSVALTALPIQSGDLLFAGSGETADEIGRCAAYLGKEQAYAGGDIVVLTPSEQNPIYLSHLMNHPTVVTQKARMGQGDAVVHISAGNLAQVEIELPPITEQTAIANALSDIDDEIATLERRRNKILAVKQGMVQQLLTGRVRLVVPERNTDA